MARKKKTYAKRKSVVKGKKGKVYEKVNSEKVYEVKVNQGYYNNNIKAFFNELLYFFSQIRMVYYNTKNSKIELKMGEERYSVNIGDKGVSEFLIWIFLRFYNEKAIKTIEIDAENLVGKGIMQKRYDKNMEIPGFKIENKVYSDKERIRKILDDSLDSVFIDEDVKEKLHLRYRKLYNCYDAMPDNSFFVRRWSICFLNIYYDILSYLLCENELLETEGVVEDILIPTLNLGIDDYKQEELPGVRMNAPVALAAFDLIYEKLDQFLFLEIDVERYENVVYNEIFLAKLHQLFRFYLVQGKGGCLYHAALPAYERERNNSPMTIPIRPLYSYNSYQGIRELRLADKILFEFEQRYCCKDQNVNHIDRSVAYRIVMIGDIIEEAMDELIAYIEKEIRLKDLYSDVRDIAMEFHVYTMRIDAGNVFRAENKEKKQYTCVRHPYNGQLHNADKLKKMIHEGDLFLFLDNCCLYKQKVESVHDDITFKQYISFDTYESSREKYVSNDLILKGKFMDLYQAMMMYAWDGKLGFLRKRLREDLMRFIQREIEIQDKVAYIYLSDNSAFGGLSWIEENMVRLEVYNQKEIGIIRFTKSKHEIFPVSYQPDQRKDIPMRMLVFNMWQFVKHLVLDYRVFFERNFLAEDECMLDQIYIALDYTQWTKGVWLSYWYKDRQKFKEENIKEFIDVIFRKNITGQKEDMYQGYLKKVFISFLYGAGKSVEDLLFLHLLKKKGSMIGEISWRDKKDKDNYNPAIKEYYDQNCKYIKKQNYWNAIEMFDRNGLNFVEQYVTLEAIKRAGRTENIMQQKSYVSQFLDDNMKVCMDMEYVDSPLYGNCQKIKKEYYLI